MTVAELIEKLSVFPPDRRVYVDCGWTGTQFASADLLETEFVDMSADRGKRRFIMESHSGGPSGNCNTPIVVITT